MNAATKSSYSSYGCGDLNKSHFYYKNENKKQQQLLQQNVMVMFVLLVGGGGDGGGDANYIGCGGLLVIHFMQNSHTDAGTTTCILNKMIIAMTTVFSAFRLVSYGQGAGKGVTTKRFLFKFDLS